MNSTEKDQGKYLRKESTDSDIHVDESRLNNYGEAAGLSTGHSVYSNQDWYIPDLLRKHIEESKNAAEEPAEA